MKSNNSITADEKNLLEYLYEKANDIVDYCHRNGMIVPCSILVEPDYKYEDGTFDYRQADFTEYHDSGHVKRIVSISYNHCTGKAGINESKYEDETNE